MQTHGKRRLTILAIAALGMTGALLWLFVSRDTPPAPVAQPPQPPAEAAVPVAAAAEPTPASSVADASASVTPPTPTPANEAEIAATRRMYMAHAPLREPELADPDSETNRRTLQTMVEKALLRATPPNASTPVPNATTATP